MFSRNQLGSFLAGPIFGLNQEIDHVAESSGKFVLIFHLSGTLLDNFRYAAGIEVAYPFAVAVIANETREGDNVFLRAVDLKVKVGFYFKGLAEVRVQGREGAVKIRIADHDYLGIGRDRLGGGALEVEPNQRRPQALRFVARGS